MKREELTEKILDIKREKAWTWKYITGEIGGLSPLLVVSALLGQMKLVKPLARRAAELFGLTETEERMLNEVPHRGGGLIQRRLGAARQHDGRAVAHQPFRHAAADAAAAAGDDADFPRQIEIAAHQFAPSREIFCARLHRCTSDGPS